MESLYFYPKQYLNDTKLWLESLSRKENVAVMFFPRGDKLRRLNQMLDDSNLLESYFGPRSGLLILVADFENTLIDDDESLDLYLTSLFNRSFGHLQDYKSLDEWSVALKKENKRILFIIPTADRLLQKEYRFIHKSLDQILRKYESVITALSLFEIDLNDPLYHSLIQECPTMFTQIFNYSLYSESDTAEFIRYLEQKWSTEFSKEEKRKIYSKTAGHTWLTKEACRHLLTGFDSEQNLNFKLTILFQQFSEPQQKLLEELMAKPISTNSELSVPLAYFQRMRFVDSNKQLIGSFYKNFLSQRHKDLQQITINDEKLQLNGVPLDNFFSRKEYKVIKLLLENKGEVVSRENIAERIWAEKTTEKYSDWAIDQLMARLRKRLEKLPFPVNSIQAVRGKGYKLLM